MNGADAAAARRYLIDELLAERPEYGDVRVPEDGEGQRALLRSLLNVRPPSPVSADFLRVQDSYLKSEMESRGITDYRDLAPVGEHTYLWRGDITTLRCGAIVNAANSGLLGCFVPCHRCIDNAIHTFSGVQLRAACADIMRAQGRPEETGTAKITPAFNLPCDYVIHTVGPIVSGRLTRRHEELLESCYRSCLELADENGVGSIAFCCISTGEFRFPDRRAAEIAVAAVDSYRERTGSGIDVIFDVFKESDLSIYEDLLGDRAAGEGDRGRRCDRGRSRLGTLDVRREGLRRRALPFAVPGLRGALRLPRHVLGLFPPLPHGGGALGVHEQAHHGQQVRARIQTGVRGPDVHPRGQGLLRGHDERGPSLPEGGHRQEEAVLHPGGLRALPVQPPVLPGDVGQRGHRAQDGGRAERLQDPGVPPSGLPQVRQAGHDEPPLRRHLRRG